MAAKTARRVTMYIRDLDEQAAREIKAEAARRGQTIGQYLSAVHSKPRPTGA